MVVSTDLENKCLTLFIWHKIEIRDEVRVLTYSLKVRFESNIIPRSLTEDTGIKCGRHGFYGVELSLRDMKSIVWFDEEEGTLEREPRI